MDVFDLDEMKFSPTAALFEGLPRAGVGISVFVVRTPPGKGVDIHVHPYSETFVLLEVRGSGVYFFEEQRQSKGRQERASLFHIGPIAQVQNERLQSCR